MNFTVKGLVDAAGTVRRLSDFREQAAARAAGQVADVGPDHPVLSAFMAALADDLNISAALAEVIPWTARQPVDAAEALGVLQRVNQVLNVAPLGEGSPVAAETIDDATMERCRQLDEARTRRDYATADRLRQELTEAGYEVRTTREGTTVRRMLA
jgi:cysteinyl-tRNA synthetase